MTIKGAESGNITKLPESAALHYLFEGKSSCQRLTQWLDPYLQHAPILGEVLQPKCHSSFTPVILGQWPQGLIQVHLGT